MTQSERSEQVGETRVALGFAQRPNGPNGPMARPGCGYPPGLALSPHRVVAGVVVLALIVAVLGPAVTAIPLAALRLGVGGLLLIFEGQWLRKAILRASGAQGGA
jgi:hypothetical protein